jgi:hypothetical protein
MIQVLCNPVATQPYINMNFQNNLNNEGIGDITITPVGSPTYANDQFGRSNSALRLNGSSQYLNTNFKTSGIDWSFTIIASVKRNSDNTQDCICGETDLTSNSYGVNMNYQSATNFLCGYFYSSGTARDNVGGTIDWNDEEFTNISFIRKNGDYHRLLINSEYFNEVSCTEISSTSSNNLRIGTDYYNSGSGVGVHRMFDGDFEYFKIYQETLNDGELAVINQQQGRVK